VRSLFRLWRELHSLVQVWVCTDCLACSASPRGTDEGVRPYTGARSMQIVSNTATRNAERSYRRGALCAQPLRYWRLTFIATGRVCTDCPARSASPRGTDDGVRPYTGACSMLIGSNTATRNAERSYRRGALYAQPLRYWRELHSSLQVGFAPIAGTLGFASRDGRRRPSLHRRMFHADRF
jgi:hypothetical protein